MGTKIELLSPAKNLQAGIEAIRHGADAVYIGAPKFGARQAAANTVSDIAALCHYAHRYQAKVYVALNTILDNKELNECEVLIKQLYESGIDALIIQDMGILMLDIPPIPLHASTQTDNRFPEKISFLQKAGFQRVILARELSLSRIEEIHRTCNIELEAFVHGALCVSYSGQCYISQQSCGRSANRGNCAQYCRLPYTLQDASGKVIVKDKHLLSLKDMNRAAYLEKMMDAGITSFKIEGRLKEISYVKNITAYYRQEIDAILNGKKGFDKSSSGSTLFFFTPAPEKSFNREMTDYFLIGDHKDHIAQINTPKSLGEYLGEIEAIKSRSFSLHTKKEVCNGDGLCFFNAKGELQGFRVNRVEEDGIFPAKMPYMKIGTPVYRNHDQQFEKLLQQESAVRKIGVSLLFEEDGDTFRLTAIDETNIMVQMDISTEKQEAKKPEHSIENMKNQFAKLGNTIFELRDFRVNFTRPWFFPFAQLSEWKNRIIDLLSTKRKETFDAEKRAREKLLKRAIDIPEEVFPATLSYLANVMNDKARSFYLKAGALSVEPAFELKAPEEAVLMFCKYCIKHELGFCPRKENSLEIAIFAEPLFLKYRDQLFRLAFDCKKCEMSVCKTEINEHPYTRKSKRQP